MHKSFLPTGTPHPTYGNGRGISGLDVQGNSLVVQGNSLVVKKKSKYEMYDQVEKKACYEILNMMGRGIYTANNKDADQPARTLCTSHLYPPTRHIPPTGMGGEYPGLMCRVIVSLCRVIVSS